MVRLRKDGNLPVSRTFELLFAEILRREARRPLDARDRRLACAVGRRNRAGDVMRVSRLLMDAGDPSSLKLEVRIRALDGILQTAVDDEHFAIPDHDALRRFAQPDLAYDVRDRWAALNNLPGARTLLMLLIDLGKLDACADIAVAAVQDGYADRYTPIFAGTRAVVHRDRPTSCRTMSVIWSSMPTRFIPAWSGTRSTSFIRG